MGVYNLNNIVYLEKDITSIFNRISNLYDVEFKKEVTLFHSKLKVDENIHWASKECIEIFNNLIPEVKSLHKDMYSVIENIFTARKGKFKPIEKLEPLIPHFKEFRLFNNKLKHYKNKEAEINILKRVDILPNGYYIDISCQFKYPNDFIILNFSQFIGIFINLLEAENIITIDRK